MNLDDTMLATGPGRGIETPAFILDMMRGDSRAGALSDHGALLSRIFV